jgi:hypothetical protein
VKKMEESKNFGFITPPSMTQTVLCFVTFLACLLSANHATGYAVKGEGEGLLDERHIFSRPVSHPGSATATTADGTNLGDLARLNDRVLELVENNDDMGLYKLIVREASHVAWKDLGGVLRACAMCCNSLPVYNYLIDNGLAEENLLELLFLVPASSDEWTNRDLSAIWWLCYHGDVPTMNYVLSLIINCSSIHPSLEPYVGYFGTLLDKCSRREDWELTKLVLDAFPDDLLHKASLRDEYGYGYNDLSFSFLKILRSGPLRFIQELLKRLDLPREEAVSRRYHIWIYLNPDLKVLKWAFEEFKFEPNDFDLDFAWYSLPIRWNLDKLENPGDDSYREDTRRDLEKVIYFLDQLDASPDDMNATRLYDDPQEWDDYLNNFREALRILFGDPSKELEWFARRIRASTN